MIHYPFLIIYIFRKLFKPYIPPIIALQRNRFSISLYNVNTWIFKAPRYSVWVMV